MRDNAAHLAAHCGILRADDRNARHRAVIHVRDGRNRRVERVFVVLNAVVNFRAVKSDVRNDGAALQKLEQRPESAVVIDSDIGQLFAVSVERAVERLAQRVNIGIAFQRVNGVVVHIVLYAIIPPHAVCFAPPQFVIIYSAQVERRFNQVRVLRRAAAR